jgi:hypothetical protein
MTWLAQGLLAKQPETHMVPLQRAAQRRPATGHRQGLYPKPRSSRCGVFLCVQCDPQQVT